MSESKKKEYRCTRTTPYDAPGCSGHADSTGRQGHYIFTESPMGAVAQLIQSFPDDIIHGFTIVDRSNENMRWVWSLGTGLQAYSSDKEMLPQMFEMADRDLEDPDIQELQKGLRKVRRKVEYPDAEAKVRRYVIGLHVHENGEDLYLYDFETEDAAHKFSRDDFLQQIPEDVLGDLDDDYAENSLEVHGPYSIKNFEKVNGNERQSN